jgi:2-polyprenyl-3-methyl-5-hydroxy-6-metoxy-1,4-benzoquinol methylase
MFSLDKAGYYFDQARELWLRDGYQGISYSDGVEVESRLDEIISQASDVSLFSNELKRHQIDWPSFYHLASCRANILRPLGAHLKGLDILEIGAGCGAITRYLGEEGANILALEGSLVRASIARKRTRDLSNVVVLAESFEGFKIEQRFDIVTLIGVLEYSRLFVKGADPVSAMLSAAKALLKPDGILVIAIENKFGLKYFAGALEDHTGQEMFGIESRYQANGPVTFGYKELCKIVRDVGFSDLQFLTPLPDYKAASSVITEKGLLDADFDKGALAAGSVFKDRQLPKDLGFSLARAWSGVFDNGLGFDLANSFVVLAGRGAARFIDPGVLAYHYNTDRIACFCKETRFKRELNNAGAGIELTYRALSKVFAPERAGIRLELPLSAKYTKGELLSRRMISIWEQPGWQVSDVAQEVVNFLGWISKLQAQLEGGDRYILTKDGSCVAGSVVRGEFFDLVPQNVVVRDSDGEWVRIDTEWVSLNDIPLERFIFRVLVSLIGATPFIEKSASHFENTRMGALLAIFSALVLSLNEADIALLGDDEARTQGEILGVSVNRDFWEPKRQLSGLRNAFDKGRHLDYILAETRKELCAEKDAARLREEGLLREVAGLSERLNNLAAELNSVRGELNFKSAEFKHLREQFNGVVQSFSWRVTRPLRIIKGWVKERIR